MAQQKTVEADPKELEKAQTLWTNFMNVTKYVIVFTAVILLGLTAAFVSFNS